MCRLRRSLERLTGASGAGGASRPSLAAAQEGAARAGGASRPSLAVAQEGAAGAGEPLAGLRRGDWLRTSSGRAVGERPGPVCKEYSEPLSAQSGIYIATIQRGSWLGPVHAVERCPTPSGTFVTVRVPSCRDPTALVWVNVAKGRALFARRSASGGGVQRTTPYAEIFEHRGWVNCYLPEEASPAETPAELKNR